jgi:hypothetical protein
MLKRLNAVRIASAEEFRVWLLSQRRILSVLLQALPRRLRWALRRRYLAPLHIAESVLGVTESITPPAWRWYSCSGPGDEEAWVGYKA